MSNMTILGGDTPFFSPSEVPSIRAETSAACGFEHKPMRVEIKGKDETRLVKLVLCAMMWNSVHGLDPRTPMGINIDERAQFMREFVAGANTDLMEMTNEPLISLKEVEGWAPGVLKWSQQSAAASTPEEPKNGND